MKRIKFHICFLFGLSFITFINAQDTVINVNKDSIPSGPETHSFYVWTGYGNRMTLASTITRSQQYFFGSLMYGYKGSLFLSASSFHLNGLRPFASINAISASYSHTFNSWFDISSSLSAYLIPRDLDTVLFRSFIYGDITAGFDWKILYTQVSAGSMFTESNSMFFQLKNSRYFKTGSFMKDKAFISFDPYVNMLCGSLQRMTTSEGTSVVVTSPAGSWGRGLGSSRGRGRPGTAVPPDTLSQPGSTEITKYFGILELGIALPIDLNYGNFTFEVEPGYIYPFYNDPSIPSPKGFTIMVNCSYKL